MGDGSGSRTYTLRRRAALQEATRQRIIEATVSLHRSRGPARTTISAIAELAGVQRHTVYRHFPEEAALFKACAGHFLASHPPPDVGEWAGVEDFEERLRLGLEQLYSYYHSNNQMISNVLRDSAVVPVGAGFRALHSAAADALLPGRHGSGQSHAFTTALRVATDFRTWQALSAESDLSPRDAAALMCRMLACL